jgi:hypothetical protein
MMLCVFALGRVACRAFPEEVTSVSTNQMCILSSEGCSLWMAVYVLYLSGAKTQGLGNSSC